MKPTLFLLFIPILYLLLTPPIRHLYSISIYPSSPTVWYSRLYRPYLAMSSLFPSLTSYDLWWMEHDGYARHMARFTSVGV